MTSTKTTQSVGHEEVEQKVTPLELFSDLTFVVAIHVVAVPIELAPEFLGQDLLVYVLRVFLLWQAWHLGTVYANVANLFTPGSDKLRPIQYVVILSLMAAMALLAGACERGDDFRCACISRSVRKSVTLETEMPLAFTDAKDIRSMPIWPS